MADRLNEEGPEGRGSSIQKALAGLERRLRVALGKTPTRAAQIRAEHEAAIYTYQGVDRFLKR